MPVYLSEWDIRISVVRYILLLKYLGVWITELKFDFIQLKVSLS